MQYIFLFLVFRYRNSFKTPTKNRVCECVCENEQHSTIISNEMRATNVLSTQSQHFDRARFLPFISCWSQRYVALILILMLFFFILFYFTVSPDDPRSVILFLLIVFLHIYFKLLSLGLYSEILDDISLLAPFVLHILCG